jgi:hypothetical protein
MCNSLCLRKLKIHCYCHKKSPVGAGGVVLSTSNAVLIPTRSFIRTVYHIAWQRNSTLQIHDTFTIHAIIHLLDDLSDKNENQNLYSVDENWHIIYEY